MNHTRRDDNDHEVDTDEWNVIMTIMICMRADQCILSRARDIVLFVVGIIGGESNLCRIETARLRTVDLIS